MKNALKWVLLFVLPIALLSIAGHHSAASMVASYAPHVLHDAVAMPALFAGLSGLTMLTTGAMPGITLEAKSRKATELRAKAQTLMQECLSDDKLTAEQCRAKAAEAKDLSERADIIAGFTATEEIERQGGTGDLVRETSPEARERAGGRKEDDLGFEAFPLMRKMEEQVKEHATDVIRGFGSVRAFLRVAQGRDVIDTTNTKRAAFQRKVLERNLELQRIVTAGDNVRAIVGTAGDVSGGSFLLPLTQVQTIFSLANVQQGLMQRARAFTVPGRTLRIPY